MASGKTHPWKGLGLSFALLGLAACSSGGGGASNQLSLIEALQDLTLDPAGTTTVMTFSGDVGTALIAANFEADGGQVAQSVILDGTTATVVWDERVSPSNQVRVVDGAAFAAVYFDVTTSDLSAPVFTVLGAQNPGLGGDVLAVTFSGPRVVESQAETLGVWNLEVADTPLDLTGSTFELNNDTQVLTIALGAGANVHASFELAAVGITSVADVPVPPAAVAGVAAGDSAGPNVVAAVQALAADEFGHVVDFDFDEAMSPDFGLVIGNFDAGAPVFASAVSAQDADTIRVTFTQPMIPGVDSVTLLSGLMDAHGNALANAGAIAVTQGATVTNDFATGELRTVPDTGNDLVEVTFVQALDPEGSADASHWALTVDSVPVDLALQDLVYEFPEKKLTVTLVDDFPNGVSFDFGPALGSEPMDVDGELFTATDFSGTTAGDVQAPSLVSVTQNRNVDTSGATLDVLFDEHLDETQAETPSNWSVGALTIQSATLMGSPDVVRLVLDAPAVPGDVTLDASNVEDPAGNAMTAVVGAVVTSTDPDPPVPSNWAVRAVEGPDNDLVEVTFDDDMVSAGVLDPLNWIVESPTGTALDLSSASLTYTSGTRTAVITFDGGDDVNVQTQDDFQITLSTMHDVGGNDVAADPLTGFVNSEQRFPYIESVWVQTSALNIVHVRFSEPTQYLDDVYHATLNVDGKTEYELLDGSGFVKGDLNSVIPDADSMGAMLVFTVGAVAGVDTLNVRGVADLAGNQMVPRVQVPIDAEASAGPGLDLGLSVATTVEGEDNDVLTVSFDRGMSSWGIEDPANYDLADGGTAIDLAGAELEFDGDRTVSLRLNGAGSAALANATAYTLSTDSLLSAQGSSMSAPSADSVTAAGDAAPPDLPAGRCRLDAQDPGNSVLVEFSEAIDTGDAADLLNFDIGGLNPDSVSSLGHRTVRATWSGGVTTAMSVHVALRDLAGNAGDVTRAVTGADSSGPVVLGVAGVIEPGLGGDRIEIDFDHPIDFSSAQALGSYTVSQNGQELDLTGTLLRYDSTQAVVRLHLPAGTELQAGYGITVGVDDLENLAGLAIAPPALVNGLVSGDSSAPDFSAAFVNLRADDSGRTVDLIFDEDVTGTIATDLSAYTSSGGQSVVSATQVGSSVVRLELSAVLGSGDEISVTGVEDVAGNAAGAISVEPMF